MTSYTSLLRPSLPLYASLLLAALVAGLSIGSSEITPLSLVSITHKVVRGLPLDSDEHLAWTILFNLRLPRVLAAALCGAALAIAGTVSQGLFRNSLASPSVLGVEAGAALGAVLMFYLGHAFFHWLTLPFAAFAGAMVATLIVFYFAIRRGGLPLDTLLLAGFALNALFGAATSFALSLLLEDHQKSTAVMHWLLGGFTAKGWEHLGLGLPLICLAGAALFMTAARFDVLALGEDVASTLSIDLHRLRRDSILCMALLVGTSVSIAGAIPFVGLVVPHLTRSLSGPQHRPLLLGSALNGASLLVLADLVARTARAPREIEVGILTSLLGAPFFLYLLLSKRKA